MAINVIPFRDTNVIPLPAAAKRKVRNPGPLSDAVWSVQRLPVEFDRSGEARAAYEEASYMRSPEMMIVTAIFKLLPDAAKAEVCKKIGTIADLGLSPHAASAAHILECMK